MSKQKLHTAIIDPIYLIVEDIYRYACTNINLTYAINEIPSAAVTIGCGRDLYDPEGGSSNNIAPEELLAKVLEHKDMVYSSMLKCAIVYKSGNREVKLLDGYITAGSVDYKAQISSSRYIKLICQQKSIMLTMRPVADFMYATTAAIIAHNTHLRKISADGASKTKQLFMDDIKNTYTVSKCIEELVKEGVDKSSLADIVSVIIRRMISSLSYTNKRDDNTDLVKIADYIDSEYTIDTNTFLGGSGDVYASTVMSSLVNFIYNKFIPGFISNTIFSTIKNTLTSDDLCLCVVPKGEKHDFKFHIEPSKAWGNKPILKIGKDIVTSISESFAPIASIATPTVYFVYFSDAGRWSGTAKDHTLAGALGIYAKNPDIAKRMRSNDPSIKLDPNEINKIHRTMAPSWMTNCFLNNKAFAINKSKGDMEVIMPKTKKTTKEDASKTISRVIKFDKVSAETIADSFAKTLYVHRYGSTDTASLLIFSNAFYGLPNVNGEYVQLHECLGEIVDVDLDDVSGSPLSIRGRLAKVGLQYDGGKSSSLTYDISLVNVRPLDDASNTAEDIVSPLYKKIK